MERKEVKGGFHPRKDHEPVRTCHPGAPFSFSSRGSTELTEVRGAENAEEEDPWDISHP